MVIRVNLRWAVLFQLLNGGSNLTAHGIEIAHGGTHIAQHFVQITLDFCQRFGIGMAIDFDDDQRFTGVRCILIFGRGQRLQLMLAITRHGEHSILNGVYR